MRARAWSAVLLLSLGALPGCLAVAGTAVVGTAAYVGGDLEGRLEASPQRIVEASEAVFQEMEIRLISSDATSIDGQVIGRTALDRKIEIHVEQDGESGSKLSIRVDTFGDEELSRQIFEKIRAKL